VTKGEEGRGSSDTGKMKWLEGGGNKNCKTRFKERGHGYHFKDGKKHYVPGRSGLLPWGLQIPLQKVFNKLVNGGHRKSGRVKGGGEVRSEEEGRTRGY